MNAALVDEPPIDTSLEHYMEERALAIALAMVRTPEEQAKIEHLANLRDALMEHRQAHSKEATAKRHARGEIYSKARVAAINALAPSREEMDSNVKGLYLEQGTSEDVLRAHARTHFASGLVSKRLSLALMPDDIAESAREMQEHEESFARAWIDAIGDLSFVNEMRELQREAVMMFRTASRPMYLVTYPESDVMNDETAAALGKAWNKLDALSQSLGVQPLSGFIAFDEEGETAGAAASEILTTVRALIAAIESGAHKIASKKQVLEILASLSATLAKVAGSGGRACFDVDV
ncbi:hypothetical protein GCM10011487_04200 [Steroidobacter agaridevorans]|uniref:Uncharacterized protein n=1 Tax=Steroidobacter agaridevorans TaxID=2695856 RepID=A0A829Y5C6_9GAMM|nr:hypothetical protein [Steroidobacter agaridevorans]GFE78420.1 hypothetical protein GCM10011487_04200 [Steroidobacter agaridevorans]